MRRFFALRDSFSGTKVVLGEDETRHLRDVVRLRLGDEISVFDGEGHEFRCRISELNKRSTDLEIVGETKPAASESNLQLTLAATILKNDRFDLVVQKAVELGVTNLTPLQTERCEVKPTDAQKRIDRWRRIALEATKQCGRARLMTIAQPRDLDTLVGQVPVNELILFSERDGLAFSTIKAADKLTAIVGPVGGWSDAELELMRTKSIKIITLGGRVLRAETAAISLITILQHRFGDLR